jgi:hypothetical protein
VNAVLLGTSLKSINSRQPTDLDVAFAPEKSTLAMEYSEAAIAHDPQGLGSTNPLARIFRRSLFKNKV